MRVSLWEEPYLGTFCGKVLGVPFLLFRFGSGQRRVFSKLVQVLTVEKHIVSLRGPN